MTTNLVIVHYNHHYYDLFTSLKIAAVLIMMITLHIPPPPQVRVSSHKSSSPCPYTVTLWEWGEGEAIELEAWLAKIKDAINIFSRPKVFVKLDHYFTTRSLLHCYYYALCAKLITLIGVTWSHVYTRKLRFWWSPLISPLWSPFWSHASIAYTGYTCLNYNYLWNAYCNASQIVIKLHMILYLESSSAGIFHFWNRRTCNL